MNSKLIYYYLFMITNNLGGNTSIAQKSILVTTPVPKLSSEAQKPFIDLVDQILEITSQEGYDPKNPPLEQKELEAKIDKMVYELYGLTEEEIRIVEGSG